MELLTCEGCFRVLTLLVKMIRQILAMNLQFQTAGGIVSIGFTNLYRAKREQLDGLEEFYLPESGFSL